MAYHPIKFYQQKHFSPKIEFWFIKIENFLKIQKFYSQEIKIPQTLCFAMHNKTKIELLFEKLFFYNCDKYSDIVWNKTVTVLGIVRVTVLVIISSY